MRTVQLAVNESTSSPEIGYLPVTMTGGEVLVLPRLLPRGDQPGFFKTTSGVAHVFYPWRTDRVDLSRVQFLIFELNLSDVEAPETELGRRVESAPRLFKPSTSDWEQWTQTGKLTLPDYDQLPDAGVSTDFYVDKRL